MVPYHTSPAKSPAQPSALPLRALHLKSQNHIRTSLNRRPHHLLNPPLLLITQRILHTKNVSNQTSKNKFCSEFWQVKERYGKEGRENIKKKRTEIEETNLMQSATHFTQRSRPSSLSELMPYLPRPVWRSPPDFPFRSQKDNQHPPIPTHPPSFPHAQPLPQTPAARYPTHPTHPSHPRRRHVTITPPTNASKRTQTSNPPKNSRNHTKTVTTTAPLRFEHVLAERVNGGCFVWVGGGMGSRDQRMGEVEDGGWGLINTGRGFWTERWKW